jgi:broad specificity phosphatase PhoE
LPARLLLVRHAEAQCSRDGLALLCGSHDAALSECGRAQVERLRCRLASDNFGALYSSPLQRAVETARAAPDPLLNDMRVLRSLAEIHCGAVEGMPLEHIRHSMPDYWRRNEAQDDDSFCWPRGETYSKFRSRVLRAIRAIARVHAGQTVLVVTHAGVVSQILGALCAQPAARWENFRPGNTAITELLWRGATGEVVRFDDREHLT